MKKFIALLLCLAMVLSVSAMAADYQNHLTNEATFETFEEARVNGPIYLTEAMGKAYVADPILDGYPAGTTYIYRSAGIYTPASAAPRMNTTILVYTDAKFEDKDAALAYLTNLGLDKIIEKAFGSIVLVTPSGARGFAAADQYAFYQLQTAMCNINGSNRAAGGSCADNNYYGGLTYRYVIGINGGATFLNEYIASNFDYVTRIAGMLTVNGSMDRIWDIASFVPVYMINPNATALAKYKAANEVNGWSYDDNATIYFNQAQPLKRVAVSNYTELTAEAMEDIWYNFLIKAERNAVIKAGLHTASTTLSGNFNQAPYSLNERSAIVDGHTADGLTVIERHDRETFKDICREDNGEFIDVWWEVLPDEVLNGTAGEHSIPLILCNHGSGDDPVQYIDETGWLTVAATERVALVAAFHQNIGTSFDPGIRYKALPALVQYMLDTYPALDPARVYASGYSMGGGATYATIYGNPGLFAAVVPMAAMPAVSWANEEQYAMFESIDLPIMITTSTADLYMSNYRITDDYEKIVNQDLTFNEIATHDLEALDFETYPMVGFRADKYIERTVNGEFGNYTWLINNDAGIPMFGINITDYLPHGLYPEYGKVAYNFMKHYARNQETMEIVYTPYAW